MTEVGEGSRIVRDIHTTVQVGGTNRFIGKRNNKKWIIQRQQFAIAVASWQILSASLRLSVNSWIHLKEHLPSSEAASCSSASYHQVD